MLASSVSCTLLSGNFSGGRAADQVFPKGDGACEMPGGIGLQHLLGLGRVDGERGHRHLERQRAALARRQRYAIGHHAHGRIVARHMFRVAVAHDLAGKIAIQLKTFVTEAQPKLLRLRRARKRVEQATVADHRPGAEGILPVGVELRLALAVLLRHEIEALRKAKISRPPP